MAREFYRLLVQTQHANAVIIRLNSDHNLGIQRGSACGIIGAQSEGVQSIITALVPSEVQLQAKIKETKLLSRGGLIEIDRAAAIVAAFGREGLTSLVHDNPCCLPRCRRQHTDRLLRGANAEEESRPVAIVAVPRRCLDI